jgi:hypothetical protein
MMNEQGYADVFGLQGMLINSLFPVQSPPSSFVKRVKCESVAPNQIAEST